MFRKIEQHIVFAIVSSSLVVLMALQSINILIEVMAAANDLGNQQYTSLTLVQYVLGYSAIKIIELFPIAVLIGALMGLGKIASANELTVIQISGVSRLRIGIIGVTVSVVLGFLTLFANEFVFVPAYHKAINLRSAALNLPNNSSQHGVWLHANNHFINVKGVYADGKLADVKIYALNKDGKLEKITHAQSVATEQDHWVLFDASERHFFAEEIVLKTLPETVWQNTIDNDLINIVLSGPENLSVANLYKYIEYQKANNIKPTHYALAFWDRLFFPLSTGVMFLLALPFVFGSQRSSGQGRKLFLGVLLGLSYFVASTSISNIILLTGVAVIWGVILPIAMFSMMSFFLLWYRDR